MGTSIDEVALGTLVVSMPSSWFYSCVVELLLPTLFWFRLVPRLIYEVCLSAENPVNRSPPASSIELLWLLLEATFASVTACYMALLVVWLLKKVLL